jgi:lipid-binding SYLF domain-containing protein
MSTGLRMLAALLASAVMVGIGVVGDLPAGVVRAQVPGEKGAEAKRVSDATAIVSELMSAAEKTIPPAILQNAEGIVVFPYAEQGPRRRGQGPNTRSVASALGIRARGIMSVRGEKGEWSAPAFVTVTGGGRVPGDLVFVILKRESIDRLLGEEFLLDKEGAVMAGPLATDAGASDVKPEVDVLAYSRPANAFAKLSLKGVAVRPDRESNQRFYGKVLTSKQAVGQATGPAPVPAWREALKKHVR